MNHHPLAGRVITLSAVTRYAVAVGVAVAAILIRLTFDPVWGVKVPYITLFPAIMLSAWLGGLWPGIVTTLISSAAAQYFWIEPVRSWTVADRSELIGLAVFVAVGTVISALNEAWRRGTDTLARTEEQRMALVHAEQSARRQIETAAQHLQAALQAGRMGTWEFTMATGRVNWSPGLEAIHGYSPGTFPGTFEAFQKEIHPADRERVLRAIGTAIEERRDHHVEYRIVRPDGDVRWVDGVGQVLYDEQGRPDRMMGVCTDVTERKQAEEARKEIEEERAQLLVREQAARAEIERASRLKDEFLAVLSHELRTPLNAVLGYAHLLSSGGLQEDRTNHAIEAIQRNAQAQARLVESLLDLSRVMAGKLELNLEQADVLRIVEAAVDVIRPEAAAKSITLVTTVPSEPIVLAADGARLQQVFWNLMSNAVKFTPHGGTIDVRAVARDSQVQITIADNGQGISRDFLPHVFDRFKQGDRQKARFPAGLGLGLALVREMVLAHGGTVSAASPGEGRGSTFTVTLPVSMIPRVTAPGAVEDQREPTMESLSRIEILIVDDESDVRDLLALLLETRGAIVRTVSSAAEALEAIRVRRPDVLLADLRMPDEDGYSLIRKLRARESEESAARLPAVAVTAFASAADREQAIAAGFDGHVAKPVDPDALARAVANVARAEDV